MTPVPTRQRGSNNDCVGQALVGRFSGDKRVTHHVLYDPTMAYLEADAVTFTIRQDRTDKLSNMHAGKSR
jgi:hypothetical protein